MLYGSTSRLGTGRAEYLDIEALFQCTENRWTILMGLHDIQHSLDTSTGNNLR